MKETTYYTPEISEFYIGFKCEILNGFGNWYPISISKGHLFNDLKFSDAFYDNLDNAFRVKHLDQEDIESCGFTFYHRNDKSYWGGTCFTYIASNDVGNLFLYHIPNKNKIVIRQELEKGENQLFEGKIRNISELKVLLKQIQ